MGALSRWREAARPVLALTLVLALVTPSLFVAAESHHDCSGDQCTVCRVLAGAIQILQQGADAPHVSAALAVLVVAAAATCLGKTLLLTGDTLVSLKVRMDS